MQLRPYQLDVVFAVWASIAKGGNPVLVLPCGSGKTPVGARLIEDVRGWSGRIVCITHVKELAQQMVEKLERIAPHLYPSICSAGLGERDASGHVVIGTVLTLVKRIKALGHRDIVLIDEAHCVGPDPKSAYQTIIRELREVNPNLRVIGMTATPWRLGLGHIAGEKGMFSDVAHEVKILDLIDQKYLVPVRSKENSVKVDVSKVEVASTGDFKEQPLQQVFLAGDAVGDMVGDLLSRALQRIRIMIFTTGKEHALKVLRTLEAMGETERWGQPRVVFGDTSTIERDGITRDYKAGKFRCLVAVRCLTTGFDAPEVDCVALFTSTMSPVLYSQMVGRGMRPAEGTGKINCLVLDYGQNVSRHGPVDGILPPRAPKEAKGEAPTKTCAECGEVNFAGVKVCRDCGQEFAIPDKIEKLDRQAGRMSFLTGEPIEKAEHDFIIDSFEYRLHAKPGKPPTLRVIYHTKYMPAVSEFVAFESPNSWAVNRARKWWRSRSYLPFPQSSTEALKAANRGGLAKPIRMKLRMGGEFPEIVEVQLTERPALDEKLMGALREYLGGDGLRIERFKDEVREVTYF